jgi:uncharacterized protein GlcG (DUF336 family)
MTNVTAEDTRAIHTLSFAGAASLIEAAVSAAQDQSIAISVAVHDAGANLVGFARMDSAPVLSIEIAQNKSYTATAFGVPTHQWHDVIKDDEPLKVGIVHTPRLVTYGGGYRVFSDGQLIGSIGVSGGHYSQDMAVAQKALETCGFAP